MSNARRCDLHTHTTHSDGTLTPTELVELARARGISCLAVTDHDTLSGIEEAQDAGNRLGLEVISGIEISVMFEPGTLHILGYFVDRNSAKIRECLAQLQEARSRRNPRIVERLRADGLDISLHEVEAEAGGGQIGRPHFAQVMVKKGYVKDADEAFQKYLARGASAYVDKRTLASRAAIQMIEESGGIAVLAHPKQLQLDSDPKRFEDEIRRLVSEGLKGIEVYSSCQSKKEAARYRKTAVELNLLMTGGSDFHGAVRPAVQLGWMGDGVTIPYETVDQMKHIILERKLR